MAKTEAEKGFEEIPDDTEMDETTQEVLDAMDAGVDPESLIDDELDDEDDDLDEEADEEEFDDDDEDRSDFEIDPETVEVLFNQNKFRGVVNEGLSLQVISQKNLRKVMKSPRALEPEIAIAIYKVASEQSVKLVEASRKMVDTTLKVRAYQRALNGGQLPRTAGSGAGQRLPGATQAQIGPGAETKLPESDAPEPGVPSDAASSVSNSMFRGEVKAPASPGVI